MKRIVLLTAILLSIAANLFADVIMLKSGERIEGALKEKTETALTVTLPDNKEITYSLSEVDEINGIKTTPPKAETTVAAAITETAPVQPPIPAVVNPAGRAQNRLRPRTITPQPNARTALSANPNALGSPLTPQEERVIAAIIIVLVVLLIMLYVYSAICLQIISIKTNQQPSWMAWIPIANLFLMCKIGKINYLWLLPIVISFIPVVGNHIGLPVNILVFGFLWYKIALARGKDGWIGILCVIPIIGLFTMGYLAFSKKI